MNEESKPFEHQISGHGALMKLSDGKVGKPIIDREFWFYNSLLPTSPLVPFTAHFHGVLDLEFSASKVDEWKQQLLHAQESLQPLSTSTSSKGSSGVYAANDEDGKRVQINPWSLKVTAESLEKMLHKKTHKHQYLLLEDLTQPFKEPCICDLKIGTRQHGDDAAPDKKIRHAAKCENTTSKPLGIRLCGHVVYNPDNKSFHYFDKYSGRKVTEDNIQSKLAQFFENGSRFRSDVLLKYIERLSQLIEGLGEERHYRFYSTSLLFIYEGDTTAASDASLSPKCDMRMIDFAHTFPFNEGDPKDDGYLFGLKNLLGLLKGIAADHQVNV